MSDSIAVQSSYVLRALDRMDRGLTAASPVAVAVIGIASLYYVAFSYGLAVVGLLFGRDSVTQVSPLFTKTLLCNWNLVVWCIIQVIATAPYNPMLVVVGVPAIPAVLVILEGADLDGRWAQQSHPTDNYAILSNTNQWSSFFYLYLSSLARGVAVWRREISPRLSGIPLVGGLIEAIWPTPVRVPYASSQGPASPIERAARSLSAGLFLPFAAYITGKLLFSCVKSTPKQVTLVRSSL